MNKTLLLQRTRVRRGTALVGTLALLLFLRGTAIVSRVWSNVGLVVLSRALVLTPDESASQTAAQAEDILRQAMAYDAGNRSARRGLGFAHAVQGREDEALNIWQSAGGIDQISALGWGFALMAQGRENEAVAVWRAADMTQLFITLGERARTEWQYEEAQLWSERAVAVEPSLGDTWYDLGLVYEKLDQPGKALYAYERAAEAEFFDQVGRSSPYYRLGVVYQWLMEPSQLGAALTAYEAAIAVDDFTTDLEAANCHHALGEVLWWIHGNPDDYIAASQRAIELNPDQVSARVLLGVAYYIRYQDVAMAEAELRKALALDPHYRWPYFYLGDIYQKSGRSEEAIAMYEQALAVDPSFESAQQRLHALQEGEYGR